MESKTTREYIVEEADRLFYQKGFEHTSFADIADAVSISRGNFYHHFKSKDEILNSVIQLRLEKTKRLLDGWESSAKTPLHRIQSFIEMMIMNQTKITLYGCPVGTLCTELTKLNHNSIIEANKLFTLFRDWLRDQFILLGKKKDADELAMHLLMQSQGIAVLANAFQDSDFIKKEVKKLNDWLKNIAK